MDNRFYPRHRNYAGYEHDEPAANEEPQGGVFFSRWFWGSFAVSVCLVSLAAWVGLA